MSKGRLLGQGLELLGRLRGRSRVLAIACLVFASACAGQTAAGPSVTEIDAAQTTTSRGVGSVSAPLASAILRSFGELQRSRIQGAPDFVPIFYQDPGGWAVEDISLDGGDHFCRHAWYTWKLTSAAAADRFTVEYTPTVENPDCFPLHRTLDFDVTATGERDGNRTFSGTYRDPAWTVERTVCPGTIQEWRSVCGFAPNLGAPGPHP